MELILVSNNRNRTYRLPISLLGVLFVGLLFLIMIVGTYHVGARIASNQVEHSYSVLNEEKNKQWKYELEKQQASVNAAKRNAEKNLDALSARLSTLQAHLLRLDALGSRLANIANISEIEFNMLESPGLGGPSMRKNQNSLGVVDFIEALQTIGQRIEDRSEKFSAMESMLMDSDVQSQVLPEGTPVSGGWTSSVFGWRTDPISGKKDFHEGIDLAGKSGSMVSSCSWNCYMVRQAFRIWKYD